MHPMYDNEDSVCGITYNGTGYFFVKNLQGDVIAITDMTGYVVAEYSYDAWGKCTIESDCSADGISHINPYRYRSYYYDEETGLYYLQSRYYDPELGRFINGDIPEYCLLSFNATGHNLFAYCRNISVNMVDYQGYIPKYINDQGPYGRISINGIVTYMSDIKWGLGGNIADNGCGIIAAYNLLLSYSSKTKFESVLYELWLMGGPFLYGKFGLRWDVMTSYLLRKFFFVCTAGSLTYLWGIKAELSKSVIVLFKWSGWAGMHFIAGIGTGKTGISGGSFRFYNTGLGIDGKELSIWQLIDVIKAKKATPIALWGVSGKKGWW